MVYSHGRLQFGSCVFHEISLDSVSKSDIIVHFYSIRRYGLVHWDLLHCWISLHIFFFDTISCIFIVVDQMTAAPGNGSLARLSSMKSCIFDTIMHFCSENYSNNIQWGPSPCRLSLGNIPRQSTLCILIALPKPSSPPGTTSCWHDPGCSRLLLSRRTTSYQHLSCTGLLTLQLRWVQVAKRHSPPYKPHHILWDKNKNRARADSCILQAVSDRQVGGESCSARQELSTSGLHALPLIFFFFILFDSIVVLCLLEESW